MIGSEMQNHQHDVATDQGGAGGSGTNMVPLMDRVWAALGFRECRAALPQWKGKPCIERAGSNVTYRFGLINRLRILISGKVMVDLEHGIDRQPLWMVTTAAISVLPPNYPVEE